MILFKDLFKLSYTKLKVRRKRLWFTVIVVALAVSLVAIGASLVHNGKKLAIQEMGGYLIDFQVVRINNYEKGYLDKADIDNIKNIIGDRPYYKEVNFLFNFEKIDKDFPKDSVPEKTLPSLMHQEEDSVYRIAGIDLSFITDEDISITETDAIPIVASRDFIWDIAYANKANNSNINEEEYVGQSYSFTLKPGYIGDKPKEYQTREIKLQIVAYDQYLDYSYIPYENALELKQWIYDQTVIGIPSYLEEVFIIKQDIDSSESVYVVSNNMDDLKYLVNESDLKKYNLESFLEIIEDVKEIFRVFNWMLLTAGSVIILIILFIIMNTIGKMVSDSTKEIGIFKTIGATKADIRKIFMMQTFIISAAGSVIGVILGYFGAPLAVYLFLKFINATNVNSEEFVSALEYAGQFFGFAWLNNLILIFAVIIIAVLVSWGRAQRGAKLDPVKALREE